MNDVSSALRASDIARLRGYYVRELLMVMNRTEQMYGADWIVAYDLHKAKRSILKAQRELEEKAGAERADEDGNRDAARAASPR